MVRLRRSASAVAVAWLLCQAATLACVPARWFTDGPPRASASAPCLCHPGQDGYCPMHHPGAADKTCAMRGAADTNTGALLSLFGPTAYLPAASGAAVERPMLHHAGPVALPASIRPTPPDPPPPRA